MTVHKPSIQTILERRDFHIQDNIWKQVVFNDFEKQTIENSKDEILQLIRNHLNNPTVLLHIEIDPSKAKEFMGNSKEYKIQNFLHNNLNLLKIIQEFDLNIIGFKEAKKENTE